MSDRIRLAIVGAGDVATAEHARHTLDITLQAHESIRDGQSHLTGTTF